MGRKVSRIRMPARRHDRWPIFLLTGLLLVLVFVVLLFTVLFPLGRYEVSGDVPYTQEEIVVAAGLEDGQNLLRIDTGAVSTRILARLPQIETVDVSISLPSTLCIRCTPAVAYADVTDGTSFWVVDRTGRVLMEKKEPTEGLLRLTGVAPPERSLAENAVNDKRTYLAFDDPRTGEALTHLANELDAVDFGTVTRLSLQSYLDISFVVEDRVRVRLGTTVDMEHKMKYVNRLFKEENAVPATEYAIIDASNTARVSLKANPAAGLTESDILG